MSVEGLYWEHTNIVRPGCEVLFPPVPGESTARHGVDDQGSVGGAVTTVYGGACRTIDWVLAVHLSDRGGSITASFWDIPLVVLPVDAEDVYEAMGMYERNEGEGCSEEREE